MLGVVFAAEVGAGSFSDEINGFWGEVGSGFVGLGDSADIVGTEDEWVYHKNFFKLAFKG